MLVENDEEYVPDFVLYHAVNTASKIVDGQLTENKAPEQKSTLVETTMLDRSKDLSKTYGSSTT